MSRMTVALGVASVLMFGVGATFTALGDDTPPAKPGFAQCLKLMLDNPAEHARLCGPGHDFVVSGTSGTSSEFTCNQINAITPTGSCCSVTQAEVNPSPQPSC
ncbi:MAG: hypothetical protein ABI697_08020 [Devosia sp.]